LLFEAGVREEEDKVLEFDVLIAMILILIVCLFLLAFLICVK
jgi:hypothetical protein